MSQKEKYFHIRDQQALKTKSTTASLTQFLKTQR